MLNSVLNTLLGLRGWEVYLIVGLLCFGEAALFLGFVIPGETAAVLGGVLASEHHANLLTMMMVVVVAAIVGDTCGYEVGKHFGPVVLRHRPLKGRPSVDKTRDFVQRKGGPAVFLGRFTALFRALVPGIAGMSEMRYRTFLFYNALGGLIWGCTFVAAGYALGKSYQKVVHVAGDVSYAIIGLAVAAFVAWEIRKRRRERRARRAEAEEAPARAAANPD